MSTEQVEHHGRAPDAVDLEIDLLLQAVHGRYCTSSGSTPAPLYAAACWRRWRTSA